MIRWTLLDRFIAFLRFSKVKKYVEKDTVLCDIGCGFNGAFLLSLMGRIKEGYGFDRKVSEYSEANIHLAEVENLENGIPMGDDSVDAATLLALLEHLNNPHLVIKDVYRILKPGGRIALTTPTPLAKPVLEFLAFKLNIISKEEISDHKHYFTPEEISNLLQSIGFGDIKVRKFQFGFNQIAFAIKK